MIDDMLWQKLVNIAQPSIALVTGILPARLDGHLVKGQGVEANFDIVLGDFEDISSLARAHVLYVAQHENSPVIIWQLLDRFFQQPAKPDPLF